MESLPPFADDLSCPSGNSDVYSFENFYNAQLPRLSLPEAHRLVEQIRNRLVGGTVNGPIDWHDSHHQACGILAAERNCQATHQARTGTDASRSC